jgi:hypothetical protein
MSIIYSYPIKGTPANDDLILISDSASSPQFATKQIKVSSLPGGSASGVSSFNTLTGAVTITGGTNVTLNPVGNNIEINAAGGGSSPGGSAHSVQYKDGDTFGGSGDFLYNNNILTVKHTAVIKGQGNGNPAGRLILNCEQDSHAITLEGPAHSGGADYTLKFPAAAPGNTQILQSNNAGQLSWINTPSGGGGGNVSQITAAGVIPVSTGAPLIVSPSTGNVVVTSPSYGGGNNAGHVPTGGTATTFLRGDGTWVTPTNTDTTYSAGTGLALNGTTFSLAANAALTNLGGSTGTTFLRKDGTWASPTTSNTNIANSNLQLDSNRQLDFGNGESISYSLDIINTQTAGVKNLFKFDQIGGTSPRFTVGHTESDYEGYITLEGNNSNRTGILKFENAAGTYYTSIQAPNTFGANNNIVYVLPNQQGAADSVLTNNGSGTLSWSGIGETGTWTPAPYVYSGTAPTVVSANGTYSIVGDICHITFQIVVTGSSSSSAAMILDGLPTVAQGDANTGEQSAGLLFVNTDSNTYNAIPSMFYVSGDKLTMVVQGGSKNSLTAPYGLKAQDFVASWYRPSAGSGITLKGSATYKLL